MLCLDFWIQRVDLDWKFAGLNLVNGFLGVNGNVRYVLSLGFIGLRLL